MCISPAATSNHPREGKGMSFFAPDSLMRIPQVPVFVSSSVRKELPGRRTRNPEEMGEMHPSPCPQVLLDQQDLAFRLESCGRDLPFKPVVFSFDKAPFDFSNYEGSDWKGRTLGLSSGKHDSYHHTDEFKRQVRGRRLGKTPEREITRVLSRPKQRQLVSTVNRTKHNCLKVISVFGEDEEETAQHTSARAQEEPMCFKQNDLFTEVTTTKNKKVKEIKWARLVPQVCTTNQDGVLQYLKFEEQSVEPTLGKRPQLPTEGSMSDQSSALGQQVHGKRKSILEVQSKKIAMICKEEADQAVPAGGDIKMEWSESANLHSTEKETNIFKVQPTDMRVTGIVVQTSDPNDFYSDSEQQDWKCFELSYTANKREIKQRSLKKL